MDIGKAVSDLVELECAKGIFVRNLSQTDIERQQRELEGTDALQNSWEWLRYQAEHIICDCNGDTFDGVATVDELKERMSKGQLIDIVSEASEVLSLGKRAVTRTSAFVSKLLSSGSEAQPSPNSGKSPSAT